MANHYKVVWTSAQIEASLYADTKDSVGAYEKIPLVNRAVNMRADALASVPCGLYRPDGSDIDWPYKTPLKSLVWHAQADLLLTGAAYWLKVTGKNGGVVRDLVRLNPFCVTVVWDGKLSFLYSNGEKSETYAAEQVIYFKTYNPRDDIQPGKSAVDVCMSDAKLIRYISLFDNAFFEKGAMPLTIIGVGENTDDNEIKRAQGRFNQFMTGISNAWRTIVMRSNEVKPVVLTQPIKDLMLPELIAQARHSIAVAFGIPQTMLEDAANFATATEHRMSFWQDTVRPAGDMMADAINRQLLTGSGYTFRFDYDELDIFQADEAQRAGSLQTLVSTGIPLPQAMGILGYEVDEDDMAAIIAANSPATSPMAEDMKKWQRKSIKALQNGKPAAVDFISDVIPAGVSDSIKAELSHAKTADDVRAVFAGADVSGVIEALREAVSCLK